jgi:NAD-dependent SIR2 family protein deacetylase
MVIEPPGNWQHLYTQNVDELKDRTGISLNLSFLISARLKKLLAANFLGIPLDAM